MAVIALDAMGGDLAPEEIVLGAIDAAAGGVDVALVGDRHVLERILETAGTWLPIVHAPESIGMGEEPAAAIRQKKGASVTVAARMVADGDAAGMVSAGSTGATLAAAAIVIGRVAGVTRPAIATVIPLATPTVVLDSGANIDVRPEHLVQFGQMGMALAQVYLDVGNPTVGLLNIGGEVGKGRSLEKEAHGALSDALASFVGNVEGHEIGSGRADVFVTDGFTGNVLLKITEGIANYVARGMVDALSSGDGDDEMRRAVAKVLPRLATLQDRFDPEGHGGAHLLGTRGVVVISHGSSSRVAVANALRLASEGADRDLVGKIEAILGG